MPPSFRRRPLTEEEKLLAAERRARFEKTAPRVITIVNIARDLGRPAMDEQDHLPQAVTQLTHMCESVLHVQNLWKRGGRLGYNNPEQQIEGALKVAEWMVRKAKADNLNIRQLTADQACLYACKAVLLAWRMLENSWDALPTNEQLEEVLDDLVQAYRFKKLLVGKERYSDEYRVKLKKRLNIL